MNSAYLGLQLAGVAMLIFGCASPEPRTACPEQAGTQPIVSEPAGQSAATAANASPSPTDTLTVPAISSQVFVLGGIHQAHENAEKYTYERMGEIFEHLQPDVLCVEVEQKSLDDGSDQGMPRDFKTFMLPAARKRGTPIVGIDWWDETKGSKWQELQSKAFADPALSADAALVGGVFQLLDDYFHTKDLRDINSPEITALWAAKSEVKYRAYRQHLEYRFLFDFEQERNAHMAANLLQALARFPSKRVLVAVGIDHKYYLERELRRRGVKVLEVDEALAKWWT
jgi:hypothetical protein